jgi:hypothetical protein
VAGVVAALAVAAVAVTAPASASPSVEALWHLDEPVGSTTMVDASGHGHDGTISTDVVLGVPGSAATAYEFTGANPLVRVPDPTGALNPRSAPLTMSAYLKVPATLVAGDYNVLQKGQATATGGAYKLEIVGQLRSARFGYPACAFNSPSGKQRVYGPRAINDGAWHLVECHLTADKVYATVDSVDGTALKRTVGSIANDVDLTLGGKPNNTHYFDGVADEVSITIG